MLWSQYRFDYGRNGHTPDALPTGLTLKWKFTQEAPVPAWIGVHTRMIFDHAYEPVISRNMLYFGSSVDCKVYALNASTGRISVLVSSCQLFKEKGFG